MKMKFIIPSVFSLVALSASGEPSVQMKPAYHIEQKLDFKPYQEIVVTKDEVTYEPKIKRAYVQNIIDIFTCKRSTWIDGTPIVTIEFPEDSAESKLFVMQNLTLTPYQYKTRKERYLYRGRGIPPIVVKSQEEMYQKLLTTRNAIGYLADKIYYKDESKLWVVEVIY